MQTNQRMGRALKWNRSLKPPVDPTTSTRDESALGSIAQFVRISAEKARFARYKRNVEAREGTSSSIDGKGNVRRQSIEGPGSGAAESGDDISETDDELDGGASETDDESDGAISDAEDEDGDLGPDNGNLPPTPTLTLNPPGVGIATTALPTDTPADVVVVSPTSLIDQTMVTMTPIVS